MSQDPSTGAKDVYYNCVNSSATQSFEVTPEHVYNHLLSSNSTDVYASLFSNGNLLNYSRSREVTWGAFLASLSHLLRYLL